ncbi:hypothetical protein JRQ81_018416 [Phrynocephalus forsythii]|uniref:Uncharacterized protein n=1 Tax=Phrynocephalus forsythii TaxID=171643 RepID=A0A9Q1AZA3_9SAUR|nr:hypothetical protein JRQ81_018416 [Phrynocephalus forsythii]
MVLKEENVSSAREAMKTHLLQDPAHACLSEARERHSLAPKREGPKWSYPLALDATWFCRDSFLRKSIYKPSLHRLDEAKLFRKGPVGKRYWLSSGGQNAGGVISEGARMENKTQ